MKRLLLAAAVLLLATPAAAQTVVLVRHAEKASPEGDPMLSAAGEARAAALAEALSGSHLTHVLITATNRTRQTAAPSAEASGVTPEVVSFEGGAAAHIARIAERVRGLPADAVVLVVGHSNTVPLIAGALGVVAPAEMADCEYDRLTMLDLRAGAGTQAVIGRYGVPATCE